MRRRHLVFAVAVALLVGVAIFFVVRVSNVEHAAAGIQPAPPVAVTTPEPTMRATQPAPASNSPRAASTAASSLAPRGPGPASHAADMAAKTDASQWNNWRDAPPIDHEHALNLLADMVAQEKEGNAEENSLRWRRNFERNPLDAALTDEATAAAQQFFSGLDADVQQHLTLGSVECRGNACQMLVAANGFVVNAQDAGPIDLAQMAAALAGQPWWSRYGYSVDSTISHIGSGYATYEITFTRLTK